VLAQVRETQDFDKSSEAPSVRSMVRAEASLTANVSLFAKSRFILSTSASKARSVRGRGLGGGRLRFDIPALRYRKTGPAAPRRGPASARSSPGRQPFETGDRVVKARTLLAKFRDRLQNIHSSLGLLRPEHRNFLWDSRQFIFEDKFDGFSNGTRRVPSIPVRALPRNDYPRTPLCENMGAGPTGRRPCTSWFASQEEGLWLARERRGPARRPGRRRRIRPR
jgi:hypothetical protein